MSFTAVILIITSAFMHALWNFIGKRQNPSLAFFFVTTIAAALIISPVLIIYRQALPLVSPAIWLLVIATGVAQTIYFLGLAGAYKRGDMSMAYPLARAIPVLLVAVVNLAIGKGNDIGQLSLLGMLFIVVGCILLPITSMRQLQLRRYFDIVYLMALVAAIGTAGYTLIDDEALRQLRASTLIPLTNTEITLLFVGMQTTSTAFMLGLATVFYEPERQILKKFMRNRSMLLSGTLTGFIIMATYGLVLASMAYVTNVSYVAAFRQLSIPIGAFLGISIQKEAKHTPKLIGIAIISVGLILVGIG